MPRSIASNNTSRQTSSLGSRGSLLEKLARQRVERLLPETLSSIRDKNKAPTPSLLEYIPKLTPKYEAPRHLAPLIDILERIKAGEPIKAVVHTPPRHGKTETLLHAIPWMLEDHPDWTMGYTTYNAQLAHSKSRVSLNLALNAGIDLVTTNLHEWRTPERGGCLSVGIGGTLTGQGLNFGIVDDPVKNRLEAESSTYRERTWDWFTDVFLTRIEPNGSVIVNMARWHPDDLAGRLINEKGWQYICLPALTGPEETQVSLWPERWSVQELLSKKADLGVYTWESLYQGAPRPRGGSVFGDPHSYAASALPFIAKTGMGMDLAYTAKTSSDYSVLVVMRFAEGCWYVIDVVRAQMRAPQFKSVLSQYAGRYPGTKIRWYAAGTEIGSADFLRDGKTPVTSFHPNGDKFTRAIDYAAMWNAGKILVPEEAPWLNEFIQEHVNFTGVNDSHDDQVDAAVAAFDSLNQKSIEYTSPKTKTERRM